MQWFLGSNGSPESLHTVQVVAYSTYLVELAMLDYAMLKYSYSMLAAAAVFTANKALSRSPHMSHSLKRHAGFTEEGILPCAVALADLHRGAPAGNLLMAHKSCLMNFQQPALPYL